MKGLIYINVKLNRVQALCHDDTSVKHNFIFTVEVKKLGLNVGPFGAQKGIAVGVTGLS